MVKTVEIRMRQCETSKLGDARFNGGVQVIGPSSFLSSAFIVLSFFPYLALPVGTGSNVPVSAFLGIAVWSLAPRVRALDLMVVGLVGAPILANALSAMLLGARIPVSGLVTWLTVVGGFAGGATAISVSADRCVKSIAYSVIGTFGFELVQLRGIRAGSVPFIEWYTLPGYGRLSDNASSIVEFVRRPFAQFPEPSFMAGTLLLALAVLLTVSRSVRPKLLRLELLALGVGSVGVILSQSGVAVVGLGLLAIVFLATSGRGFRARVGGIIFVVLGVAGGLSVLEQRSQALNFSWTDRLSSIRVSLQYWFSDPGLFIFGLGRGGMSRAFMDGSVRVSALDFTVAPKDVWSVAVRDIVELGLIVGGIFVAFMLSRIAAGGRRLGYIPVLVLCAIWLLVACLATSYESAVWIWIMPGACQGIRVLSGTRPGGSSPRL
ncbi:hypothetical protein [Raineyella fluvialis]|uniref:O-antigen ligase n=1 Tax=Raineyella fluvialis TaxID=2662261 RepID=A0A5Q2F9P3_9ACTN|nr:hypothetical protein [Raineyella fluvialis]QGF23408.1 hypothetical protein Rai3103_06715 [Raineyella fluvialis]